MGGSEESAVPAHVAALAEEHGRSAADVLEGIRWLIGLRWACVVGLLVLLPVLWALVAITPHLPVVAEIGGEAFPLRSPAPFDVPFATLIGFAALVAGLNVVYLALHGRLSRAVGVAGREGRVRLLVHVQIAADILTVAAISHFAGGIESPLPFFVVFHMICVASVLTRRAAFVHAAFGFVLLASLANLEFYGVVPHHALVAFEPPVELHRQAGYLVAYFTGLGASLIICIVLTNHLAAKVRREQGRLKARVLELSSFYSTVRLVTSELELEPAFDRVMEQYREVYAIERYALQLFDPGGGETRVHSSGADPLALSDAPAETHVDDDGHLARVPLRAAGRTVGVLVVEKSKGRPFRSMELSLLETIGANLALAAVNANLFRDAEKEAMTDGLTGLVNRRELFRRLQAELAHGRRHEHPVSVVLLDIDHFKNLNDTYGHLVGDEVLRQVAALLEESARESDVAARYGGEEFVLILSGTGEEDAKKAAERVRRIVDENRFDVGGDPRVTISAGVATWTPGEEGPDAMLGRADAALYEAKESGRNRVCAAAPPEAESAAS